MARYQRHRFRFKILHPVSELESVDEFAIAEAFFRRYREPVSVRLLTRTLYDLDCKGWVHLYVLENPIAGTSTTFFTTTSAGKRAPLPPAKSFREVVSRLRTRWGLL